MNCDDDGVKAAVEGRGSRSACRGAGRGGWGGVGLSYRRKGAGSGRGVRGWGVGRCAALVGRDGEER